MKTLLLLALSLLLTAAPLRSFASDPPDIVVVRIWEGSTVTAIITRGEGKSEKIKFDNGVADRRLTRAAEGYHKLFAQLYSEGYTLQSTFASQESPSISFVTLLFVKSH